MNIFTSQYRSLIPPLLLCASVIFLWGAEFVGWLADSHTLMSTFTSFLISNGLLFIFLIAVFENIVGFTAYFPGSVVILGVMASTIGHPLFAIQVYCAILFGMLGGLFISYIIGRTISPRTDEVMNASRSSLLLFWHPHSSSATAFLFGTKHYSNAPFLILLGCFLWSIFWALIMYFGLGAVVQEIGWDYVTIAFAGIWLIVELFRLRKNYAA